MVVAKNVRKTVVIITTSNIGVLIISLHDTGAGDYHKNLKEW